MRHTYIFIGLTPSERSLLETLISFDQEAGESLAPVRRPEDAHLIFVNGDDHIAIEGLQARSPRALIVLVGQPPSQPAGAYPVLRRPLEMGAVAEVLSRLDWPVDLHSSDPTDFGQTFSPSTAAPSTQAPPAQPPAAGRAPTAAPLDPSAFAPTTATMPVAPPAAGRGVVAAREAATVSARTTWSTSERAPLAATPSHQAPAAFTSDANPNVLVVTGRLGQRSHTLPRGLRRIGLRVRLLEGAEAALKAFAQRPLPFVFLDQVSLGDELLPLARALAAQRPLPGQPPHVVVVARHGSAFDRLRARLIGCTWMTVPIDRKRLLAFFARRGLHPQAR